MQSLGPGAEALRVVQIDGAPWFVAVDVCRALGFDLAAGGAGRHTRFLAVDEKGGTQIATLGGPQRAGIISESGLYKLIMRSDKPQARAFQDWVARVVLPAIRKDDTGRFRRVS